MSIPISPILDFLKKTAFKVFSSFVNKAAWDGYFIYTCEIVNDVDVDDAKEIADFAYKKSSLKIICIVKEELSNRGYSQEIVDNFINVFVENIKDKDPVIYLLFNIETLEESYFNVEEKLSIIQKEIDNFRNNPLFQLNYFNIDEYDNYLRQCSRDNVGGTPCLDIFNFEDKDFTLAFSNALNNGENPILICGEYQKETFFATLCELKKAFSNDYLERVYIINSREDYQKILTIPLPDETILINSFFNADSIPVFSKYINVHIVSKWKTKSATVRLKPRLPKSTRAALEKNGFTLDIISKLMRKRKNVFPNLFRELFNETDNYEAKINENIDKKALSTALLVNKFSLSSKSDVAFIEKLSGYSIDEFEEKLLPASLIEMPFAKIVEGYSQKQIEVLDFEEAFRLFSSLITPSFVNRFFELAKKAICTLPEMYVVDNYIRKRDEEMHSESFLNSVLESVLFFTVSNQYKKQCLNFVETFINWIEESNSVEHYKYFSDYLGVLTEISPLLINQKIAKDISDNKGLWLLFDQKEKDDFLFPREKYVEVLWAMEKLLFFSEERKAAINSLFELYRLKKEYRLANNPKNSLQTFFLAWMNTTPATTKEKIELCDELFSVDSVSAWELFSELVYSGGGETASPFSEPRYIKYERFSNNVPHNDIVLTYRHYNDLIIEKAQTPEQIVKLIKKHSFIYFGEESIKKAFKTIKRICKSASDDEKEMIAGEIRSFIHTHRRHCDTSWAVSEHFVRRTERLLNSISFENPEMKYIHLFKNYSLEEPHPIPFNHGDYDYAANEANEEQYFNSCFDSFVNDGLNIDFLYSYFNQKAGTTNVYYRFYSFLKKYEVGHNKKDFSSFAMTLLKKAPHIYNLFSYFGRDLFYNHYSFYYEIANLLLTFSKDFSVILEYLYSGSIDVNSNDYVSFYDSLSGQLKRAYWKSLSSSINFDYQDSKSFCFIMDNLLSVPPKESLHNPYLEILYFFSSRYKNNDLPELILKYLSNIENEYITNGHLTYLPELLKILHSRYAFTDDIDAEAKIAALEIIVIKGDEGRNAICLKNLLARQPDLYFSFLDHLYINKVKDDTYKGNLFYLLQFSLKFCPGYVNNFFHEDIFNNWLVKFKELVYSSTFEHKDWLYYSTLGKLFKYALPEGDLPMPKAIIDYIEGIKEEEHYKEIKSYYCIETNNSIGVRTISDGSDLIAKANGFREKAKVLKEKGFVKTAEILDNLADDFTSQGNAERKRAEDEW